jgi:hypothetical protein
MLASCAKKPADPLEWKLTGDTPAKLQEWLDTNLPLLTPELGGELAASVRNIKANIHGTDPVRSAAALYQKLNGHTVREIVIEGHKIGRETLLARLDRESYNLLQLVKMSADLTAAEKERMETQMTARRNYIAKLQETLGKIDSRLAELTPPPAS